MFEEFLQSIPKETWDAAQRFLGSLFLLIVILLISSWKKINMSKAFLVASIRGLIQLLILASILSFLFQLKGIIPLIGVLFVMIFFAAKTAAGRLNKPDLFKIELISLGVSVTFVMLSMSLLQVIPVDDPAFWIPIGGMVTGNSMNISYLTLNRIFSETKNRKNEIEAALSLGASPTYLMQQLGIIPTSMRVAITPNTNNLRTLGIVFIPGLMTGLLIGGLNPIAAAFLQIMIFFLILSGGLLASLISSLLVESYLFDKDTISLKFA